MGILKTLGIVKNNSNSVRIFEGLMGQSTFVNISYQSPADYIQQYWRAIPPGTSSAMVGNLFELIICTLLYCEQIKPFYKQAKVAFVPNVHFDALLYNQSSPVSLSLKTSLRERYKQADLEAIALKYVHRKAKCYLLTMDSTEARVQKAKIATGDIIGLDDIIDCNTDDINKLIASLKTQHFIPSQQIEVVEGHLIR